jgi:hypothetical protein
MHSEAEGLAKLNDAIVPGPHSGTGKIEGGIYAQRSRRLGGANHRPRHYDMHGCISAMKAKDGRERPTRRTVHNGAQLSPVKLPKKPRIRRIKAHFHHTHRDRSPARQC